MRDENTMKIDLDFERSLLYSNVCFIHNFGYDYVEGFLDSAVVFRLITREERSALLYKFFPGHFSELDFDLLESNLEDFVNSIREL